MVPTQVALGVIGVLPAALCVAHNGCGSWTGGGQLGDGGGVTMGRGCGGPCSCGRKGRSGLGGFCGR